MFQDTSSEFLGSDEGKPGAETGSICNLGWGVDKITWDLGKELLGVGI